MVFRLCWPWWGALGGSTQVLHLLLHVFHLSCCLLRVFFFLFPLSLVCLKLGLVLFSEFAALFLFLALRHFSGKACP